jgi:hypothetical protein
MKSKTPSNHIVYVSAESVEAGHLSNFPITALHSSEAEAIGFFLRSKETARKLIEKEIQIIKHSAGQLSFTSPYILSAVIFSIPPELKATEEALAWISEQLNNNKNLADKILSFESVSIASYGETPQSLDDFLSGW